MSVQVTDYHDNANIILAHAYASELGQMRLHYKAVIAKRDAAIRDAAEDGITVYRMSKDPLLGLGATQLYKIAKEEA